MDQSNQTPKAPENQEQKNDAGSNASGEKSHETQIRGMLGGNPPIARSKPLWAPMETRAALLPSQKRIIPSCFPFSPIFPCFGW